jgi:hypothetical protein
MSLEKFQEQKIKFSEVVAKFENPNRDRKKPFLTDGQALYLIRNLSDTSKRYIKMKKKQIEEELGRILNSDEYRVFRDGIFAEVCKIELADPNIRKSHELPPAE